MDVRVSRAAPPRALRRAMPRSRCVPPFRPRAPRRPALLPDTAVPRGARAADVPARRGDRTDRVRSISRLSWRARSARIRARAIVDVHADWRTSTRLYGSPAPQAARPTRRSRLCVRAPARRCGPRRSPATRPGSSRDAGVKPAGVFPAYMDLDPSLQRPPDAAAGAAGRALRRCARGRQECRWPGGRLAARRPQSAGCTAADRRQGHAHRGDRASRGRAAQAGDAGPELSTPAVAAALDEASFLAPPSRSEGLGRVVIEALCRAPSRGRLARRWDPRSDRGWTQRPPRGARRHRSPGRRTARPCSPTATLLSHSRRERGQASRPGSRRRWSTRPGCGCSSSTREAHRLHHAAG